MFLLSDKHPGVRSAAAGLIPVDDEEEIAHSTEADSA
jgi:hypothetical protein